MGFPGFQPISILIWLSTSIDASWEGTDVRDHRAGLEPHGHLPERVPTGDGGAGRGGHGGQLAGQCIVPGIWLVAHINFHS